MTSSEPSPLAWADDTTPVHQLTSALHAAVGRLRGTRDLDATLRATVAGAVDAIAGAERAGITQVDSDGTITSRTPSDHRVGEIDKLQSEFGEGPCLDALALERTVYIADLAEETIRWPTFSVRALDLGAVSVLSFRLSTEGTPITALNLYSSVQAAFDYEDQLWGEVFASHAAIALAHATNHDGLTTALNSRDMIGQAKGMLMERFGITGHEAFTMLVESSQQTNLKLRDVAQWLTGNEQGVGALSSF